MRIPDTVVSIGADAFYHCDDLQYVTIPASVTSIGENAFGSCYSLDSISVAENNTKFSSSNGVLFNKDKTKLIRTPTRIPTDYTIPNGVVSVEAYAFDRCRYLKSLTIPASVSNIGDGAFQGCDEITDVYYCGGAEQWAAVTIGTGNDSLTNATLHYITQASAPTASVASGEVESGTEITLTAEDGVTIYYSVDGSDPTNVYSAPIVITEDTTIKAFATKTGLMDSDVVTYTYTVKQTEESPDTPTAPDEPIVPADAPTLTFGDMQAKSGGTVVVPLAISNNPGLAGLSILVSYDSVLTLNGLEVGEALTELDFTNPKTLTANPLKLLWDGVDADASNGAILYLTFTVAENAEEGDYSISATYDAGDIYDGDMNDVDVVITAGKVTVKNSTPGDVNDDGIINGKDVTLVRRPVLGGYEQTINEDAADVNDDGVINGKDVTLIRRYIIGGYGVELK